MSDDRIEWTGDLDDDCSARLGLFSAHSEATGGHLWYCSVWHEHPATGRRTIIFFSGDYPDLIPSSSKKSRKLAEAILRACHATGGVLLESSRVGRLRP